MEEIFQRQSIERKVHDYHVRIYCYSLALYTKVHHVHSESQISVAVNTLIN